MSDQEVIKSIFIDTCAISKMEDNGFWRLLAAAKEQKIKIFISEVVIWEKSKARHKVEESSFFYSEAKGIPLNAAAFKKTLQGCNVHIIEHNLEIIKKADHFIQDSSANFDKLILNELRDAHIIAAAECTLDINAIIVSNDKDFIKRVPILTKFTHTITQDDITKLVESLGLKKPEKNPTDHTSLNLEEIKSPFSESLLSILPMIDPEYFNKFNNDLEKTNLGQKDKSPKDNAKAQKIDTDKLTARLVAIGNAEIQIRKRILGYTHWFAPTATKEDLHNFLINKKHSSEEVESLATKLKQENLLIETENRWLTNIHSKESKEICEQAMAAVMPEILEILELA